MGTSRHRRTRRAGFTLIELLVVIAIIAVLVGLSASAVMKLRQRGPEVQTRAEIGQLETALVACRADFGLDVVPSRLVLREDGRYTNSTDHTNTVQVLKKMFGRNFDVSGQYDWNGNGGIDAGDLVLEGHHCLVFFLGGIPAPPGSVGCTGFNTDRSNPAARGGTRIGPFFEFKPNRLKRDGNGMLFYLDPWEAQPYAYFSATKAGNDYRPDCPALRVSPYYDLSNRFLNPNSYQIISAGPDQKFGAGGRWDPTRGYGPLNQGADDLSNFSRASLGMGQQ